MVNVIESLLEPIDCTIEEKVIYATYILSREAKRWLQSKNVLLVLELGSEQAITWEIFKEEFCRHFFPEVVLEAKGVHEPRPMGYVSKRIVAKVIQLSRFAIYLIPNEEKKAKKFERGLNPWIRTMMASSIF